MPEICAVKRILHSKNHPHDEAVTVVILYINALVVLIAAGLVVYSKE